MERQIALQASAIQISDFRLRISESNSFTVRIPHSAIHISGTPATGKEEYHFFKEMNYSGRLKGNRGEGRAEEGSHKNTLIVSRLSFYLFKFKGLRARKECGPRKKSGTHGQDAEIVR